MILKQFQGEGIPFGLNLFFMHVTHPFSHDYFILGYMGNPKILVGSHHFVWDL